MSQWSSLFLSWMDSHCQRHQYDDIIQILIPLQMYFPSPSQVIFFCLTQRKVHLGEYQAPHPQNHTLSSQSKQWTGDYKFFNILLRSTTCTFTQVSWNEGATMWVAVESVECDPISIVNMLWLQPADRISILNPIMKHSLTIWDTFRATRNLQSTHNHLLSFLWNPAFYLAWESPGAFAAESATNLFRLHNLVNNNAMHTFPTLCKTYGLPRSELFRYLQAKKYIFCHFLDQDPC